ncbi:MAG: hypothetical protein L0Y73_09700, partial [Candidatus Aminicenantes bacterium]|nr:hypothetical protein [Candidatus Aminicenantes bacterium]
IVTASIIAFASFWNALDFGWKNSRLELLSTLSYSMNRDKDKDKGLYDKILTGTNKTIENYIENEFRITISDGSVDDVDRFIKDLKNAIKYYRPETLGEKDAVDLLKSYRLQEEECVKTIKIPFFNIGFDINDLGFIGGFSFFILMLILYYSQKREHENLDTVHAFIAWNFKGEDKIDYYYLMSMNQVLSSPQLPAIGSAASAKQMFSEKSIIRILAMFFLKHFSKALYFLPFVLMAMIFIYDCRSVDKGLEINRFSTLVTIIGGFTFTIAILIVTLMCIFFSVRFDKKWDEIRAEVITSSRSVRK